MITPDSLGARPEEEKKVDGSRALADAARPALDDYRPLQEGEFSAPGDLVLEDGRRGLNRSERVSQMEPSDVGCYFRMERLPERCAVHTHYVLDDGSGCLCGYFTKAKPAERSEAEQSAPSPQPKDSGAPAFLDVMYRDNGDYAWWAPAQVPKVGDCKDGEVIRYVLAASHAAYRKALEEIAASGTLMGLSDMDGRHAACVRAARSALSETGEAR